MHIVDWMKLLTCFFVVPLCSVLVDKVFRALLWLVIPRHHLQQDDIWPRVQQPHVVTPSQPLFVGMAPDNPVASTISESLSVFAKSSGRGRIQGISITSASTTPFSSSLNKTESPSSCCKRCNSEPARFVLPLVQSVDEPLPERL